MDSARGLCLRCLSRRVYGLAPNRARTQHRSQHPRPYSTAGLLSTSRVRPTSDAVSPQRGGTFPRRARLAASNGAPPQTSQRQRLYATLTSSGTESRPKLARLSHRRLLAVHGQDAAHFLQGLTTLNVPTTWASSAKDGFYSAFLNAQGRLLHDVFIYPAAAVQFFRDGLIPEHVKRKHGEDDPSFVIEADADGIESLYKHLRRYKLRAKVDMWMIDPAQARLVAAFGHGNGTPSSNILPWNPNALRCIDNRSPGFGTRVITQPESQYDLELQAGLPEAPLPEYHRARHVSGIPEGQSSTGGELPYAASLPHETNVDLMGGIDFRKGCYVGQELTIRTQHKGVVRKRILPISLYKMSGSSVGGLVHQVQEWVHSGATVDIMPKGRRGRSAGRWVSGVPGDELSHTTSQSSQGHDTEIGLAMCRLEMLTDLVVEAGGEGGGVKFKDGDEFVLRPKWEDGSRDEDLVIGIKAHVPAWIREGIESRTKRGGHDRAVDSEGSRMEAVG